MARKNKKNIIFVLIILILVGYIAYDKLWVKDSVKTENLDQVEKIIEEETKEDTVVEKQVSNVSTKSVLETCIEETKKEIEDKGTKYTKGTILISFVSETTFEEAKKIITDFKYSIDGESGAKDRFEDNHKWFVANVPSGREFEAICKLEANDSVKYVSVNPVFEIHE